MKVEDPLVPNHLPNYCDQVDFPETTNYNANSEEDQLDFDPLSSIVITHVETVSDEDIDTTEPEVTDPDQLSDLHNKLLFNCGQNEFSTDTHFALIQHQTDSTSKHNSRKSSVGKGKVFKCKHCSFECKVRKALQKHTLRHIRSNFPAELHCQHCGFVGGNRGSLTVHINNSHKKYTKPCERCHKLIPLQLKKHHQSICVPKEVEHYDKPTLRSLFKRDKSSKKGDSKEDSVPEQKVKEEIPEGGSKIPKTKLKKPVSAKFDTFNCIYCSFKGKSDRSLMLHSVKIHLNATQRCTKCLKIVPNHLIEDHFNKCEGSKYIKKRRRLLLQSQQQKVFKPIKKEIKKEKDLSIHHQCQYCSFSTLHKKVLKKHLELHELRNLPLTKCDQCDYEAPSPCLIFHKSRQHKAGSASPKKVLNCINCNFNTENPLRLKEHSLKCKTSDGPMKCRYCSFKASSYRSLFFHSSNKHNSYLYKCKFCGVKLPTQLKAMHSNSRCERNPNISLKCHFCSYTTQKKKHLDVHLRQHTVLNNPIVKCPQCDFKSTKQSVGKHRRTVHVSSTTLYKCGYCTFTTTEILELRQHVGTHNPGQLPDNHNCEYCSFKTRDFKQFHEHYMTSHQGSDCSLFNCPRCDFRSSIINMISHCVKRHQLEVTPEGLRQFDDTDTNNESCQMFIKTELGGNQTYKCLICPETAKYQYQIKAHVLTHNVKKTSPPDDQIEIIHSVFGTTNISSSNVMFICETCDYSTPSKEVLVQHKKIHTEDTTKCEKCKGLFGSVAALMAHQCPANTDQYTVKTDGKSTWYDCKSCQFKSCGKSRMLRHWSKRHQDNQKDTMFSCPFCPLRVDYKIELQKHILNCHGLDQSTDTSKKKCSYKCDTCDFETNVKSQLHTHKVVHVNINEVRVYKTETYNVGMKGSKSTSLVFKKNKKDT